ncbi:Origin recognition complex subunit 5 [Dinochytrium kinnereticum]|nr:Origin recognition complex subunit 5 [Dinochytrium kinnereticum]
MQIDMQSSHNTCKTHLSRLKGLLQTVSHPDAWHKLRNHLEHLSKLEKAKAYLTLVILLHDINDELQSITGSPREDGKLSTDYIHRILSQFREALRIFESLLKLEGAGLIFTGDGSVADTVRSTRAKVAGLLEKRLHQSLFDLGWPIPISLDHAKTPHLLVFRSALTDFLTLRNSQGDYDSDEPVRSMINLLLISIRYHFRDKKVRRADKPEWLLSHILKVLKDHAPFFSVEVQRSFDALDVVPASKKDVMTLVIKHFSDFAFKTMLENAREISSDSNCLVHMIQECRTYDTKILEAFLITARADDVRLVNRLALQPEILAEWVEFERKAGISRLKDCLEDNPFVASERINGVAGRPSISAEVLIDTVQMITEQYQNLPSRLQLEFFKYSQKGAFRIYLTYVEKAIENLSNLFIPISHDKSHLEATSSRIFLEMWEEVKRVFPEGLDDCWGMSVFDRVVREFDELLHRGLIVLNEILMKEFTESFWMYDKKDWVTITDADLEDVSSEFFPILTALEALLKNIRANLDTRFFKNISNKFFRQIEEHIIKRVVLRKKFSPIGAKQFHQDIESVMAKLLDTTYKLPSHDWHPRTDPNKDKTFNQATLPCIFAHGPPASGKTSILREAFSGTRHAFINCMEYSSSTTLLPAILSALSRDMDEASFGKRMNLVDFVWAIRRLVGAGSNITDPGTSETRYIILDNADHLREMSPSTMLPALMKIQEAELKAILIQERPSGESIDFYSGFVNIALPIFHPITCDLNELRRVHQLLFIKYMEPIQDGTATRARLTHLYHNLQFFIKEALDRLFTPELSQILNMTIVNNQILMKGTDYAMTMAEDRLIGLPSLPSYLLIAAFLASYNPQRLDITFFTKATSKKKLSKNGRRTNKIRQQLLGPKPFPLERMLAIFRSVVQEEGIESGTLSQVDIQGQIGSLESMHILKRATPPDRLDSLKYKCMASFEYVLQVSKRIQFDIAKYLFDFS